MVHYKLSYFNNRGKAEIARQLFVLAGQEFEDKRYASREEYAPHASETPFGLLPVLEVDGKQLSQSNTIARYLARKFGYAGKTPFEEALVDSIADQYNDFFVEILPYFLTILGFRPGDEKTLAKELVLPAREKFFTHMTKWLKNSKSGFLVGDSVTWADLLVAEFAELTTRIPNFYDGFPEVKAHADKIRSIPTLKKWIQSRPRTPL